MTNLPEFPKLPPKLAKIIDKEIREFIDLSLKVQDKLIDDYQECCSKELDKQILGENKMFMSDIDTVEDLVQAYEDRGKDDFREPTFEDKILQSLDKLHTRIAKLEIIVQDIEFKLKYG